MVVGQALSISSERAASGVSGRPRVVVAGQFPPPASGQHIAVEAGFRALQEDERFEVVHLPYSFSHRMEHQGAFSRQKVIELLRALARLLRIRADGRIDVLLYPLSGTNTGAVLRDLVLLPVSYVVARRTVVQFHGAGHRRWADDRRPHVRLTKAVLGHATAAIVHAEVNSVDARAMGIDQVVVVPHQISDDFDPRLVVRGDVTNSVQILYLGHLGPQRGTPALLTAVAKLVESDVTIRLVLAGAPVGDYSVDALTAQVRELGLDDRVELLGEVAGQGKNATFGRANLFVFPTTFDAESFGLVLAEALMWGLPIVATDWRANREILDGADAIVHPHSPELPAALGQALREAIELLRSGRWKTRSERNRKRFLANYCRQPPSCPLGDALERVLREAHA